MTPFEEEMGALKARLSEITDLVPAGSRVAYLDYPVHGNFGDLLIFLGGLGFLQDHEYRIESCASLACIPQRLSSDTIILLQGGGNFGDLYPHHQSYRDAVIARFPNNRVVILPQTVHFQTGSGIRRARQVLESHPDLHLILRDVESLELAKRHFPNCRSRLLPDMAHYLWAGPRSGTAVEEDGRTPLFLLRDDKEKGPVSPELNAHSGRVGDWSDFYTPWQARQIQLGKWIHRFDGKLHGRLRLELPWARFCNRLRRHLTQELSRHDPWITSRLHGAIFGTLLGKRIRLLDNSYSKNKRYYETWCEDFNDVVFIASPDRLGEFL